MTNGLWWCLFWCSDMKKGEEITYNYQLDNCENLFGQQVRPGMMT